MSFKPWHFICKQEGSPLFKSEMFWPFSIFFKVFTSRRPAVVPVVWRMYLTCLSFTPESCIRRSEASKNQHLNFINGAQPQRKKNWWKYFVPKGVLFFKANSASLIKKNQPNKPFLAKFSTLTPHSVFLLANIRNIICNECESAVQWLAFHIFSCHCSLLQWSHFCAPSPLLFQSCLLSSQQLLQKAFA